MAAAALQEVSVGTTTEVIRSGVAVEIGALPRTVGGITGDPIAVVGAGGTLILGWAGALGVAVTFVCRQRRCPYRYRVILVAKGDLLLATSSVAAKATATVANNVTAIIVRTLRIVAVRFTRILTPCAGRPALCVRAVLLQSGVPFLALGQH